jgi:hypothetical protein
MLSAAALALIPGAAAALAIRDPANGMKAYARMRGGRNGDLALWWYTGNVWGKTPSEVPRVLFTVQGLTFQRVLLKADGSLEQRMAGRGWYADAATGRALETWINPLTGARLDPPHIRSLAAQTVRADGALTVPDDGRLALFEGRVGGLAISGDTLWMTENFVAKSKPDTARGGAVATSSSLSTFTARVADVEDDAAGFVPCQLNYQNLGSWPAWMAMAERPGMLSWQTYGHKLRSPDQASAALRDWIEARHAGFLRDPGI